MLGDIAKSGFNCDLVTAFVFRPASQPRAVSIATNSNLIASARKASCAYSDSHWQTDPSNIFFSRDLPEREPYAVRMEDSDISDARHRYDCFTTGGIVRQVSLIVRTSEEYLKMSFCRSQASPNFTHSEIESWAQYSDLLSALLLEHSKRTPAQRSGLDAAKAFSKRLSVDHPYLTERERTVCSLIAVGMTSTGIALTLGVSVNTVLTFRRRAYARLNITSHGELLRLVL
jgi:DNA-binding CsgD family transcriptional regulator